MHKFLFCLGGVCALLGVGLLSPLVDLLPVELLQYLSGDFNRSGSLYLRVVPEDSSPNLPGLILLTLGAGALAIGWVARRRK